MTLPTPLPPRQSRRPALDPESRWRLHRQHLDASGGMVVSGGVITEVLAAGQQPSAPC